MKAVVKPNAVLIEIPVQLPDEAQIREILTEAAKEIIRERDLWLSMKEAAQYLRISPRSFLDFRKRWRVPVYDVGKGLIYRPHLDAVVAELGQQPPGRTVFVFPSPALRNETAALTMQRDELPIQASA